LICICFIIGVVEHVQEVSAHKTLDIDDDGGADAHLETGNFESSDSNTGPADLGDAIVADEDEQGVQGQNGEDLEDEFKLPPTKPPGLQERFIGFFKHEPIWYYKYYRYEMLYLLILAIAIIKFQTGKSQNDNIATAWRKNIVPILFNEFAHMGCGDEDKSFAIMQKTYADYGYFASGRKNCKYAEF